MSLQDVFGKEVRAIHFSGKQFILEKKELSAGVYFVKITDELRNSISKKIIVE
ncbi:MAG: T9SS type A sorting domain-containing protein [Sphingobacteriaceae bacterium]|nr:T9SS type A sorting domain-containing protein [Sphingobacteriaceae bacterium]